MDKIFKVFVEGSVLSSEKIPESFLKAGYVESKGNGNIIIKVCGLINFNNILYVFMPKGYDLNNLPKNQEIKSIKLLYEILLNHNLSNPLTDEEVEWNGKQIKNQNYVKTVTWLINDYQENGYYQNEETKIETNGKGRVLWNKTLRQKMPYIINDEVLYLDMYTKRNEQNINDIIRLIHKKVIQNCIREIGLLYNLKQVHEEIELPYSIDQQIIILHKKLNTVYTDRKISLLKQLINYLELKHSGKLAFTLATPYFYNVWELMLRKLFNHEEELQGLVPKPYWEINGIKNYTKQIPDILITKDDSLVIIDAKYYSIDSGQVKKFPGWPSIVKQLYYNLSLKKYYKKTYNIFIFPKIVSNSFEYIGKTSVKGLETEYGYIYAYAIDINDVFEYYKYNREMKEIIDLIIKDTMTR
ncbi:LlaJI family restriction endonuclease [Jeotgalicoccus psychrophilus]|uniref:LlaJI family restriction endonuclease n=1 Tax=Jeotgalicoccus psychrophilus TaxID=157228 RepID=UPI000424F4B9|nr:LlaJI family restriction endonuclease [Jeotgalicoccus psychrophilus]